MSIEKGIESVRLLSPLILAADFHDLKQARVLSRSLKEYVDIVKVGLELFSARGPSSIKAFKEDGFEVFLDLKICDIPNTVASTLKVLTVYEPLMISLHTMGGKEMMRAASRELDEFCRKEGYRKPLLIGVTVLTSMDLLALKNIGVRDSIQKQVERLSGLSLQCGLDGLVSSPHEILDARRVVGGEMLVITPGVRFSGDSFDDQKRVATPGDAMRLGADFIVVGRPFKDAKEPEVVAKRMLEDAKRISK
ncbi:MAG: orotidine-5'-phosphate decarboxylase [Actinomycetota bacterium]|nr:orotidine-5'-phosphate decarboxylase [Actinomycetota bacterium]